jgi:hypothetical protein
LRVGISFNFFDEVVVSTVFFRLEVGEVGSIAGEVTEREEENGLGGS